MDYNLLYKEFPLLTSERLVLRKIEESDSEELFEIYGNENIFRLRPGSAKKSKAAVRNMIGHFVRDFKKKKTVFLGIYLKNGSRGLAGVAEIFDADKRVNAITIGYTLNQSCWGNGYAAEAVKVMLDFLFMKIGVNRIQAFVMPRNVKSKKVLLRNSFTLEGTIRQGAFWPGKGIVDLELYSMLRDEYKPASL